MNHETLVDLINAHPSVILLLIIAAMIIIALLTLQYTDKCAHLLVNFFSMASSHPKPSLEPKESSSVTPHYLTAKMIVISLKWFVSCFLVKLLPDSFLALWKNMWIRHVLSNLPWYQTAQEKILQIEDKMTDKLASSLTPSQHHKKIPVKPEKTYLKKLELYRLHRALEIAATRFEQTQNKENLQQYQTIFSRYQALYNEIIREMNSDLNGYEWQKYRNTFEHHHRYLNGGF